MVLLVEDDAEMADTVAFLLRRRGYDVVHASNGREALDALDALRSHAPCIILLDLMMPEMDGWELRTELLKDPARARLPVVILSGVSDLAQQAESLQAVGYLTKPVDMNALYGLVAAHCG